MHKMLKVCALRIAHEEREKRKICLVDAMAHTPRYPIVCVCRDIYLTNKNKNSKRIFLQNVFQFITIFNNKIIFQTVAPFIERLKYFYDIFKDAKLCQTFEI